MKVELEWKSPDVPPANNGKYLVCMLDGFLDWLFYDDRSGFSLNNGETTSPDKWLGWAHIEPLRGKIKHEQA